MRSPSFWSVAALWFSAACLSSSLSQALVVPQQATASHRRSSIASLSQSSRSMPSEDPSSTAPTTTTTTTVDDIKADIARMRQEALQRLDSLNEQMSQAETAWKDQKALEQQALAMTESTTDAASTPAVLSSAIQPAADVPTIRPAPHAEDIVAFNEVEESAALLKARMERDAMHFVEPDTEPLLEQVIVPYQPKELSASASIKLLDNTRWRLMLNIGRESGTWMPKTWGASGERLRIHLELEFSPEQLYEREEFLNGVSGAKVLKVIREQGELAPTLQEGGRTVRLGLTGGWRVAPNDGPMGTSVLRFYIDLEETTQHAGSDVYCPAGRIYCTCGYFPMAERHQKGHVSEKDSIKQEMRQLETLYETLATAQESDTDLISWNKFKRSKTMMELRTRATKLNTKMHEAQVREPEKSLLRMSQDQEVGLTREGGVCCKVNKGLAIEYHILGKFEIASMANREHSNFRDMLLP